MSKHLPDLTQPHTNSSQDLQSCRAWFGAFAAKKPTHQHPTPILLQTTSPPPFSELTHIQDCTALILTLSSPTYNHEGRAALLAGACGRQPSYRSPQNSTSRLLRKPIWHHQPLLPTLRRLYKKRRRNTVMEKTSSGLILRAISEAGLNRLSNSSTANTSRSYVITSKTVASLLRPAQPTRWLRLSQP